MPEKSLKRSINFSPETLKALDTLAAKNSTTTSELVRQFVEKGLSIEGYSQDIDFIARIVRQELMAVYHLEVALAQFVRRQAVSRAMWSTNRSSRYAASGRPAPRYASVGTVLVITPFTFT